MAALSAGVRLVLLCALSLNVAAISSQTSIKASITPTPPSPSPLTQTFIILLGASCSSAVVIILLYSVFCTALCVIIMVKRRRRELRCQSDTALREFNKRPPECADNFYEDTVPNRAGTNDDPEYAAPTSSHSEAPQPINNEMPLYYTTVVRQEGQKVSVKVKASAVTDLD